MPWQKTPLDIFIPQDRRQALSRGEILPTRSYGAVLFADISGFTKLTSTLSAELGAKRGAEELIRQLDPIYTDLVQAIHSFRGSVIVISGEGVTCWFDQDDGRRATACAFAMQKIMAQRETILLRTGQQISLGIRITLSVGPVRRFLVGDPDIQLIETLAGRELDEVVSAQALLQQGEVAISGRLLPQLDGQVTVRSSFQTADGTPFVVVEEKGSLVETDPWPDIPALEDHVARRWVFASVYQRLRDEEIEFLTELRQGLPMFVKFSGLDYDNDELVGEKLDVFIRRIQSVLVRYEGYLCQLTIGDKGSNLFIAFGAPVAHEDDVNRALSAALHMREISRELDFIQPVQISLTSGQLWAGAHGGKGARTYSVIGAEVNLAARLMDHAKPGQILVSPHIVEMTMNYSFAPLAPIQLKGIPKPMPPFVLLGKARAQSVPVQQTRMFGRESEQAMLKQRLIELTNGAAPDAGGTILIEGAAGIGKSVLVDDFIETAGQMGVKAFTGNGDPVETATQYYAARPIFEALFEISDEQEPAANQQTVFAALQGNPFLIERLPLLSEVIPLRLPDNELTGQMIGEARAISTREFLLEILRHILIQGGPPVPSVIVLDDAQWLDAATWSLISSINRELPGIQLVISLRSVEPGELGAQNEEEFRRLREDSRTEYIQLQALPEEQITGLVARKLRVKSLPPAVLAFIQARAQGNPFFSEEIAYALRDAGVLRLENGEALVRLRADELARIDFPHTIQGVITSRIDRLSPSHQLTLKVASVIGRVFLLNMLSHVHPSQVDISTLEDYLKALTQLGITELESPTPELAYLFKHVITQEVVYNLLTFSQRKQLHCAIAQWYEMHYASDPSPYYPRLAHHWMKGEFKEKAIHYLDKAAEQALELYSNEDVIRFISLAMGLYERDPDRTGKAKLNLARKLRLARWQRMLGVASLNLGYLPESIEHYKRAFRILGHPVPQTKVALIIQLIRELLIQVWHRLQATPQNRSGTNTDEEIERELAQMAIEEGLFFTQDVALMAWAILRRLNVAERAGMPAQMAECYSNLVLVTGFIQSKSLLNLYRRLMWKAVEQANRSSTRLYALARDAVPPFANAEWEEQTRIYEEGRKLALQLGDTRNLGLLTGAHATCFFMKSKYRETLPIWFETYQRAVKLDNPQELAW